MAAKKKGRSSTPPAEPLIHEAMCATDGSGTVYKGKLIDEPTAVARRKQGQDVVVCGSDLAANRNLARRIEAQVSARYILEAPHTLTAGSNALPHFQPDPRPPEGHTFYEGATKRFKARQS